MLLSELLLGKKILQKANIQILIIIVVCVLLNSRTINQLIDHDHNENHETLAVLLLQLPSFIMIHMNRCSHSTLSSYKQCPRDVGGIPYIACPGKRFSVAWKANHEIT